MHLDVRTVESATSAEIYITAVPSPGVSVRQQAEDVFSRIKHVLQTTGARLFQERVFAGEDVMEHINLVRAKAYGDLDDGVPPSRLSVRRGVVGDFAGVQVHAIPSPHKPEPLKLGESVCGRILKTADAGYVALSGLAAPEAGPDPSLQARAVFEKAEAVLEQVGADMRSVARTWLWLGDILSWYGEFNRVRNRFYSERGLLDNHPETSRPPASTGIGVSPAGGSQCALDLIAILGKPDSIHHYPSSGNQQSPHEYGSAFARASRAVTPAGETVFVSGTAAIDARGVTQHVGNAQAQIEQTIEHVRAVLSDMECTDQDVVQAIAYSKTIEVEKLFTTKWKNLPWPCLSALADICRDELLFEIEVTASPGVGRN